MIAARVRGLAASPVQAKMEAWNFGFTVTSGLAKLAWPQLETSPPAPREVGTSKLGKSAAAPLVTDIAPRLAEAGAAVRNRWHEEAP